MRLTYDHLWRAQGSFQMTFCVKKSALSTAPPFWTTVFSGVNLDYPNSTPGHLHTDLCVINGIVPAMWLARQTKEVWQG